MRIRPLSLSSLAILALLLSPGCAWPKHKPPPQAAAPIPGPRRVGTIAVVNDALHFVLIDVGTLYIPLPGTALKSFSGTAQTAILAVNPERQRPFIAADIIEGHPTVGDQVQE